MDEQSCETEEEEVIGEGIGYPTVIIGVTKRSL